MTEAAQGILAIMLLAVLIGIIIGHHEGIKDRRRRRNLPMPEQLRLKEEDAARDQTFSL